MDKNKKCTCDCVGTAKQLCSRPSPPMDAERCPGKIMQGNDERWWISSLSKKNKGGYIWRRANTKKLSRRYYQKNPTKLSRRKHKYRYNISQIRSSLHTKSGRKK